MANDKIQLAAQPPKSAGEATASGEPGREQALPPFYYSAASSHDAYLL